MGMTQRDGMGREMRGDSGVGTYVHTWWIHVDVWQNQYSIVKQNKVKTTTTTKTTFQEICVPTHSALWLNSLSRL